MAFVWFFAIYADRPRDDDTSAPPDGNMAQIEPTNERKIKHVSDIACLSII